MDVESWINNKSYTYEDVDIVKNYIISSFKSMLNSKNYIELPMSKVTSGIDPSVLLLGSHSSVVKPLLKKGDVPPGGIYLIQKCVRTQTAGILFKDEDISGFASNFTTLGITVPGSQNSLEQVSNDVNEYLLDILKINPNNICVRVSSGDQELIDVVDKYYRVRGVNIEIDTKPENYYRHRYGLNNIYGKNFNIALKHNESNSRGDIGNVVMMQDIDTSEVIATELGFGVEKIVQNLYEIEHVLQTFKFVDFLQNGNKLDLKLWDAVATSFILLDEGLKPGSGSINKILRRYMRAILYFLISINSDPVDFFEKVSSYEQREFGTNIMSSYLADYIKNYYDYLVGLSPNDLDNIGKEDNIILEKLNLNGRKR